MMNFLSLNFDDEIMEDDDATATGDTYEIRFGKKIQRTGKIFSYTFWRTEIGGEVFWSLQGNRRNGSVWIVTKYFGTPEASQRYQQEVILHHPHERKIKMYYAATCVEGMNYIHISRDILQHFKTDTNGFNFEFRVLKVRRHPQRRVVQ